MLKVHFYTFHGLGRVMHNIARLLMQYSPDCVEQTDYMNCDVTIEHIIGDHWASPWSQDKQLSERIKHKKFALLWYCFGCPVDQAKGNSFFDWSIENATMIYTSWPFDIYGYGGQPNVVEGPLGYDQTIYQYQPNIQKRNAIMSTGHVAATECLEEIYAACQQSQFAMYHAGHNFRWDQQTYRHYSNIPDQQMRDLYSHAKYVSGLRRGEGFEIPVIEGAACGARPIVFDNPHYHWFRNFAIYIKENSFDEVRNSIYNIFKNNTNVLVTEEERKMIRETFAWDVIAKRFWDELLKRM